MITDKINIAINAVILVASLLSIVFTSGVVWRVEKRLDLSYKLFLLAILSYTGSVVVEAVNPLKDYLLDFAVGILNMLFAVFFLAGIYTMRNMIRKIDGEKKDFSFLEKGKSKNP